MTQQAQAQDTSTYSGIFSPARKMNFSKSKRDKTSIVTMEKEWDIEVPLPYSANRDMAFKEKLGEIILAFNHPVYTKHGDILQDSTLKNSHVIPTKQRSLSSTTNSTRSKAINLIKKPSISTGLKPLFGCLSMKHGEYYVTMFLPNDESDLKYQESTFTLNYAAVHYTEQLVDWAIQHNLYEQPLWAWTQQHIKMIDKVTPAKSRKGRIQRATKKVPIWNHINVPKAMIDPKKQYIQNHAHLATQMGTSDIIKASTVTTPQTWNRHKFDVKFTVKGHKSVTIKTKQRMKEFAAKQKAKKPNKKKRVFKEKGKMRMNDDPSKTPYSKIFDINLSKKVRNEQETKGRKPPTHDKEELLKKVKKKIQKKNEERKEPRNQSKRPLIRMIDPDETDPLLLELKAEWMEKEKIPRKSLSWLK